MAFGTGLVTKKTVTYGYYGAEPVKSGSSSGGAVRWAFYRLDALRWDLLEAQPGVGNAVLVPPKWQTAVLRLPEPARVANAWITELDLATSGSKAGSIRVFTDSVQLSNDGRYLRIYFRRIRGGPKSNQIGSAAQVLYGV